MVRSDHLEAYLAAMGIVGGCTALAALMRPHFSHENLIMVFLLGVVLVAAFLGRGPAILASVLSVAAFDFFFVEPHLTFAVADTQYLLTFAVMLVVALTISTLIDQARRLADRARAASVEAEAERMRSALLSSVSHDLRTPLAAITGAASSLATDELEPETRRDLAQSIADEAQRMDRLVGNLLDVTRLESGVALRKEWYPLEEVVGAALAQVEGRLGTHPVRLDLPEDLPLIPVDAVLLEQALINLLDNAARHGGDGTPIDLRARNLGAEVEVAVADRGSGLPPGLEAVVFDKFFRGGDHRGPGVGLGLTICRGIVEAHGGRVRAQNREGGGAEFAFTLPLGANPPRVVPEDEEAGPS